MNEPWRLAVAGAATAGLLAIAPASGQLDQAVSEAEQSTAAAARSQAQIDRLADERGNLFREYRATLQRIDAQKLFVEQQKVYLRSQEAEIADLQRQITEIADVLRNLLPMQFDMIEQLEAFVRADIPFLRDERLARVARLRSYMDNPQIAPAERYRQIVDAFEIEADYGRGLRTWSGPLIEDPYSDTPPDASAPTVNYLLVGRVAFIWAAQDYSRMGIWNEQTRSWQDLPGDHRAGVRDAIRMARETASPNVFLGPVRGASDAAAAEG